MRALVILRVVSGRVQAGQLDAIVEAYRRDYVPVAQQAAGLDRFLVSARSAPDGGDLAAVRTLDGRNHGELLTSVDYYEIDEHGTRSRPGAPTRLRLTAGTVARGLDADIQQELRRRLPDLPAEAIEAYVGRRVLGNAVEIALVTTWSAAPSGVMLDAPLFPAISDRYDAFRIAVLDVLLDGAGAG